MTLSSANSCQSTTRLNAKAKAEMPDAVRRNVLHIGLPPCNAGSNVRTVRKIELMA